MTLYVNIFKLYQNFENWLLHNGIFGMIPVNCTRGRNPRSSLETHVRNSCKKLLFCYLNCSIGSLTISILIPNLKSNQGNQDYSGNQKNIIQGQRPDMENRHEQHIEHKNNKHKLQSNKSIWANQNQLETGRMDQVHRQGLIKSKVQRTRKRKGKLWRLEQISFHDANGYTVTKSEFMTTTIKPL